MGFKEMSIFGGTKNQNIWILFLFEKIEIFWKIVSSSALIKRSRDLLLLQFCSEI